MWSGLGQAATVAQLVSPDVGGLISMIMQAAVTARQNKEECEQLARRAIMIAELLPHLQHPEVMRRPEVQRPLVGLDDTLREAHELVTSCQGRAAAYRLVMAGRQAKRFRDVQSRIDSYLLVFPFISHIDITRRLDRMYNILLPNNPTLPSPSSGLQSMPQDAEEVTWEVPHGVEVFTMAVLAAVANNFDTEIGKGGFGKVYKGCLPGEREVAIKRQNMDSRLLEGYTPLMDGEEAFRAEITTLSSVRHDNIVRLYGCCAAGEKRLLVYEYMKNGTLHDHLHGPLSSSSSPSPVTTSWRMRIEILLGVSRALEHLQSYAERPVIHRDIKPSNILLDDTWAPRLTDFGFSLTWDEAECSCVPVVGTYGYAAPEYVATGNVKPVSDVYSLGVVKLEVLSGEKPVSQGRRIFSFVEFARPIIKAGKTRKLLDKRPTPKPTRRQRWALDLVARTAVCCLRLEEKKRPAISEVVVNLKTALELIRCDDGLRRFGFTNLSQNIYHLKYFLSH